MLRLGPKIQSAANIHGHTINRMILIALIHTYKGPSTSPRVDRNDDSMLKLEREGGRPMGKLDPQVAVLRGERLHELFGLGKEASQDWVKHNGEKHPCHHLAGLPRSTHL